MPPESQTTELPVLPDRVPQNAETSFDVPQASAEFRTVPKDAEDFGKVPQVAERKENHTLTVRETARMFETAGVARTERSIINWCQPNRHRIARLDAYFDPNERKYLITSESVAVAIAEEKAKVAQHGVDAKGFGTIPKPEENPPIDAKPEATADVVRLRALEAEVLDLKITNRAKDYFIDQLKQERGVMVEQLTASARQVGELEAKLLQIAPPNDSPTG